MTDLDHLRKILRQIDPHDNTNKKCPWCKKSAEHNHKPDCAWVEANCHVAEADRISRTSRAEDFLNHFFTDD